MLTSYWILAFLIVAFLLSYVWKDWMTYGYLTRECTRGIDALVSIWAFIIAWWQYHQNFAVVWPFMAALWVFFVVRYFQYLWYVGCLNGLQSRYILYRRRRWRDELRRLDTPKKENPPEILTSPSGSKEWQRIKEEIEKEIERRKAKLRRMLRNTEL